MADIKRINYFDGLLIKEDDFILEQDYHIRLRRLHNRHFHKHGIIQGLDLQYDSATKKATVTQGMALDQNTVKYADNSQEENSREIILTGDRTILLSSSDYDFTKDTVYFYIRYNEATTDKDQDKGGDKYIHWEEEAVIESGKTLQTQAGYVYLGKVTLSDGKVDKTGRIDAGFYGVSGETRSLTLGIEGQGSGLASINGKVIDGQNGIEIDSLQTKICGDLTVTGDLTVQGTNTVLNTQTLEVKDNIITLNKDENGGPGAVPPNTSGIEVYRGTSQKKAQLLWDETNTQWQIGTEDKKPLSVKLSTSGSNVDISENLTVHGLLTASNGNAQNNGIAFAGDPGGGSGDVATIRYYYRTDKNGAKTENCTLEINVANDPQDHIALMTSGNVGIGTTEPQAQLQVTKQLSVGPFATPNNNQGVLEACGTAAGISFFKRSLTTYPASPIAGDRYQWYNNNGTACLWTDSGGDLFKVDSTGNVTVGRTDKTGTLTISGSTSGNALSVTGSTNISSSLTVGGSINAGSLTVNGQTTTKTLGIGTTDTSKALLTVGGGTGKGYTTAIFGQDQGIALVAHAPHVGFNCYYNGAWKSLSGGYSGLVGVDPGTGGMSIYTCPASKKADEDPGFIARLSISAAGEVAVTGNIRLPDKSIYFRGGTDNNHFIGWQSAVNGPGIYGYAGGALGYHNDSGQADVLTWDSGKNINIDGKLMVKKLNVPVGFENFMILRGTFYWDKNPDGNDSAKLTVIGDNQGKSGWTWAYDYDSNNKKKTGIYKITFTTPFSDTPTIVTHLYAWDTGENSKDDAIVYGPPSKTGCTIFTTDNDDHKAWRGFSFIAIGPR